MNIGIFSGSFNPIHIGHVALANYITEFTDIDEVWFLVSPQNPLKNTDLLNEDYRFRMVELALQEYTKMKASKFEFDLPRPSYTINTLKLLENDYPEYKFSLIVGADNWADFYRWKNYEEIISNYPIFVYPRLHSETIVPPTLTHQVIALKSPIIEISSTFIRESIADKKNIQAFLPEKVYEYILENNLYK